MLSNLLAVRELQLNELYSIYSSTSTWIKTDGWKDYDTYVSSPNTFEGNTDAVKDFCRWFGVSCEKYSSDNGDEVFLASELNLGENGISGALPNSFDTEGGGLGLSLQSLNMAKNNLIGPIPEMKGLFHGNLKNLHLGYNSFTGTLPYSLFFQDDDTKKGKLQQIDFSRLDEIIGPLPSGGKDAKWNNLSSLELFDLHGCQKLSGTVPEEALGALENIVKIRLDGTNLSGNLPNTIKGDIMGNLQVLRLDDTNISGEIPIEWENVAKSVKTIRIDRTLLTGEVPEGLCAGMDVTSRNVTVDCSSMNKCNCCSCGTTEPLCGFSSGSEGYKNAFSVLEAVDDAGLFPVSTFYNIESPQHSTLCSEFLLSNSQSVDRSTLLEMYILSAVYFGTNGKLWAQNSEWEKNTDICAWSGLECNDDGRVEGLDLSENNLEGPLPDEIWGLSALKKLDLSGNLLRGSIPSTIGKLYKKLEILDLSRNDFSNGLPKSLFDLSNAKEINVSNNPNIGGTLQSNIGGLTSIENIDFHNIGLSGSIPEDLEILSNVELIRFDENILSGQLPEILGAFSSLKTLRLDENQFEGTIPRALGDLENLERLYLDDNIMQGSIPAKVCTLFSLQLYTLVTDCIIDCDCCTTCNSLSDGNGKVKTSPPVSTLSPTSESNPLKVLTASPTLPETVSPTLVSTHDTLAPSKELSLTPSNAPTVPSKELSLTPSNAPTSPTLPSMRGSLTPSKASMKSSTSAETELTSSALSRNLSPKWSVIFFCCTLPSITLYFL